MNELLVPRKAIYFQPIEEGRFMPFSSDFPEELTQPMVRSKGGSFMGFESGYRSGLIRIEEQLYKIKGCRPEGGTRGNQPKGSQKLSIAQIEADNVLERREVFLREGFDYPLEPIGLWVYDQFQFEGEPNAATIFKTKGDTRIDEFLWWTERIPLDYLPTNEGEEICSVFDRAGFFIGRRLKTFHRRHFAWDDDLTSRGSNAHLGNVVIFQGSQGLAEFGIIDFDISVSSSAKDPKELKETVKAIQERDYNYLFGTVDNSDVVSRPRRIVSAYHAAGWMVDRIINRLAPDVDFDTRGEAGGYLLTALGPTFDYDSKLLRKRLQRGLEQGYKNGNRKYQPIDWQELVKLSKGVERARKRFIKRAKSILGDEPSEDRLTELAEKLFKYRKGIPGLLEPIPNFL